MDRKPSMESPHIRELVQAFWTLRSTKSAGMMGYEKISLTDIAAYVNLFGMPACDMDLFIRQITSMDSTLSKLKQGKSDG